MSDSSLAGRVDSITDSATKNVEELTGATKEFVESNNLVTKFVFILGVLGLLFVPIFKLVTYLPPYMGMLLSLGCIWAITEYMHRKKSYEVKKKLTVIGVVKKIDVLTIFFFLGILLAVHGLQTIGTLDNVATYLNQTFYNFCLEVNYRF